MDRPERRGERSLPHRPAIKGRRPTATSEARFRAHRKCTYHLGFSLGELRGLEAKFRTALADETAQIDQDFTGHENGESSELRALINRASRGAEFGPAFAALAAGRNMPDGAMSELQVHRGLPGYLLPLDVVMPTLCSKGASWQNSRLGSFCSANVTCVAKIWSSSLTTVQPMSTGTVLPSASRDRAEPLTGALSLCSSALGTAMKVDPVSTVSDTYGYNPVFPLWFLPEIESSSALGDRRFLLVIDTAGPPVADPQLNLSVGANFANSANFCRSTPPKLAELAKLALTIKREGPSSCNGPSGRPVSNAGG